MADTSKLDVPVASGVVGSLPRSRAVKDMLPPATLRYSRRCPTTR